MKTLLALSALLIGISPKAQAGEAWQTVFEDASVSVAIDSASIRREKKIAVFRERHILRNQEVDMASLRRIQEIQYRRQADCSRRSLSELSRAVFSEQGALMQYEANHPSQVKWEAPRSGRDIKLIEAVCGLA